MEKIYMACYDPECPCEDMCCQECEKVNDCPRKCSNIIYIEKIYSDDNYLIKKLVEENEDSWIIEVGAKKLGVLLKTNKELFGALKSLVEAKEIASKNPEGVLRSMEYRWERATKAIAKAESSEISKA